MSRQRSHEDAKHGDLPAALSRQPAPPDPAEIEKRTLDRLSRLSPPDPAEAARKHPADSLRRLTRILQTPSNENATTER